jgi:hypothetical protein
MEIVKSDMQKLPVPADRLALEDGITLGEGVTLMIGYGENDDPDAPFHAVLLELWHPDRKGPVTCAFLEKPPVELLSRAAIDVGYISAIAHAHSDDTLADILSLGANRAFTPKAKLRISRGRGENRGGIDVDLEIGKWQGQHEFERDEIAHLFGL